MNIESKNAALIPTAHQAASTIPNAAPVAVLPAVSPGQTALATPPPAPPQREVSREIAAEAQADMARAAQANQRRMEIAEKIMGTNKSLVIEKDTQRQGFIYKTVDRTTGEVVRVWPLREVASALQALADKDAQAVVSGMLIDAKA